MISAQKENFLFSSLEKGGRYGTRKPGTHHLRLPHGNSRLPRHFCLQGLQVILLSLPRAGILMSILRELFRKFPFFFARFFCRTGVGHRMRGRADTPALSPQTEQRQPSTPKPGALCLSPSELPSVFGNALCLHTPFLPHRRSREAESGGNYF